MTPIELRPPERANVETLRVMRTGTSAQLESLRLEVELDVMIEEVGCLSRALHRRDRDALRLSSARLGRRASLLGLGQIERVAFTVTMLARGGDETALAACTARLFRLASYAVQDIWDLDTWPS